jgi:hypothetical protein
MSCLPERIVGLKFKLSLGAIPRSRPMARDEHNKVPNITSQLPKCIGPPLNITARAIMQKGKSTRRVQNNNHKQLISIVMMLTPRANNKSDQMGSGESRTLFGTAGKVLGVASGRHQKQSNAGSYGGPSTLRCPNNDISRERIVPTRLQHALNHGKHISFGFTMRNKRSTKNKLAT